MNDDYCAESAGHERADAGDDRLLLSATPTAESAALEASLSAIASAKTESLHASGCAIGMATSTGDVDASVSAIGLATAEGHGSVRQSWVGAFAASDGLAVSQSVVPLGVAKTIVFEQSGTAVGLAGQATVRNGFVGLLLSGRTELSEDSRVLLDTRAALIIGAVLFGGFGLVALALYLSARRLAQWRPTIALPSVRDLPGLRRLPTWGEHAR